ncbi:MAG: hypothetical protein FWB78_10055 [Treponema sp.]|nr:hypothetical protein [Treponema sp.]
MEDWNASREKALELRPHQWGRSEEEAVMSVPIRQADSRRSAMECLREIAWNGPFVNRSRPSVRLVKRSLGKIVCRTSVAASFCQEAHHLARRV